MVSVVLFQTVSCSSSYFYADDPEISVNSNGFVNNFIAEIVRIAFEIKVCYISQSFSVNVSSSSPTDLQQLVYTFCCCNVSCLPAHPHNQESHI